MYKRFHAIIVTILLLLPFAALGQIFAFTNAQQVFQLSAKLNPAQSALKAEFTIVPGNYLYKDKINVANLKQAQNHVQLGQIFFPPAQKMVEAGETFTIYPDSFTLNIPIASPIPNVFYLKIDYQGCSKKGICFPPVTKYLTINWQQQSLNISDQNPLANQKPISTNLNKPTSAKRLPPSEQGYLENILQEGHWMWIGLTFLLLGLLLAFTPCVLPMLPILSSLILGQKNITTYKAFSLSLAYIIGVAITYAIIGVLAGLAGSHIQAAMQSPWILSLFSLLFVILSLSMFGFYELRLPKKLEHKITQLSNQQSGGTLIGALIMGILSTLIVSPCVSAPLVAALGFIGQTGQASLGGFALFSMGIGMGIPLLIIGTLGIKYLPKTGAWMYAIKALFGVILLAMAIWLLGRFINPTITLFLYGLLLVVTGIFMGAIEINPTSGWPRFWKGIAFVALLWGVLMLIGASLGNESPFTPLQGNNTFAPTVQSQKQTSFILIHNLDQLHAQLALAKQKQQPTIIDFYADWCTACQIMERTIFQKPQTAQAVIGVRMLKIDVTANDHNSKALQQYFKVFAPPTIIFYGRHGNEVKNLRLVGETNLKTFLKHTNSLLNDNTTN